MTSQIKFTLFAITLLLSNSLFASEVSKSSDKSKPGTKIIRKGKAKVELQQDCPETDRIYDKAKPGEPTVEIGIQKTTGGGSPQIYSKYTCKSK